MDSDSSSQSTSGGAEPQTIGGQNTEKNQRMKARRREKKQITRENQSSDDQVTVYVKGITRQYFEKRYSRKTLSTASEKFSDILSDGREQLELVIGDHYDLEAIEEALQYINDLSGLSADWRFNLTEGKFEWMDLNWLIRLARLWTTASTMGISKLMRAAHANLQKAITVAGPWMDMRMQEASQWESLPHIHDWVNYIYSYIAGASFHMNLVVGCVSTECDCPAGGPIRFDVFHGAVENKRCGYRDGEPMEITDGRRMILKMVSTFEQALDPIYEEHEDFELDPPQNPWAEVWKESLTPDRRLPRNPPSVVQPASASESDEGVAIGGWAQLGALSRIPIAIGSHYFPEEYEGFPIEPHAAASPYESSSTESRDHSISEFTTASSYRGGDMGGLRLHALEIPMLSLDGKEKETEIPVLLVRDYMKRYKSWVVISDMVEESDDELDALVN